MSVQPTVRPDRHEFNTRGYRLMPGIWVTVHGRARAEVSSVANFKTRISQAAALHRQAAAVATAAGRTLDAACPAGADQREQHDIAAELRAAAALLAPGWLGAPLDAQSEDAPLGGTDLPGYVRIGTAQPLDDARFPVIVPMLGTGHLTVDMDVRDHRVAGLLRSVLVRLLATAPPGSLLVRAVDPAGAGVLFGPFAPLIEAGLMAPAATDRAGLRATLTEVEQWVRPAGAGGGTRTVRRERTMLLVVASLPGLAEGSDLDRIEALAQAGPSAGLHLMVAGWPPPPLTADTCRAALPHSTAIRMRNPYALVGDPPGARFGVPLSNSSPSGLNAPVFLDRDPPALLVAKVCQTLAEQGVVGERPRLAELLPAPPPAVESGSYEGVADGLVTLVGYDGDRPVSLRFNDLTPNWMIGGRSDAGRAAFLTDVLYGLCARYRPADLALYLLDCGNGDAFGQFAPTEDDTWWLPQARAIGVQTDPDYGLAVLAELDAELTRRADWFRHAEVSRFADLPADRPLPRILCVIDQFPHLFDGPHRSRLAGLLEGLTRNGRAYGIHLLLSSDSTIGLDSVIPNRDGMFGQFPVRVALPGGGDVLEPTNDAAACLPLGSAVVNTAGGLGGPRGATRGHERTIRFPDPAVDGSALSELRQALRRAYPDTPRPPVFTASTRRCLDDDPAYQAALARPSTRPAALLGRVVDVPLSVAAFPMDAAPGRHLAVFGSGPGTVELLDAAARSLSVQHAPRTARFVVASLASGADNWVDALAAELRVRQEVETVDADGMAKALGTERPGYLVVHGMDVLGSRTLPSDRLRELLTGGPRRGVHLLSSWRSVAEFSAMVAEAAANVDGLVFLDVDAADVSKLVGRSTHWQPRPGRALLHDRHVGGTAVIAPFRRAGEPA